MDWFKTYQDGILRGSLATTDRTTQLIWIKLLAVGNETRQRDGWLHFAAGIPMSRDYLASVCMVTTEELDEALRQFQGDLDRNGRPRIEIGADGDIYIKNWEKYQAKPPNVIAGQTAAEKAKETKKQRQAQTDRIEQLLYNINMRLNGKRDGRYVIDEAGTIMDTVTGEIVSFAEAQAIFLKLREKD